MMHKTEQSKGQTKAKATPKNGSILDFTFAINIKQGFKIEQHSANDQIQMTIILCFRQT